MSGEEKKEGNVLNSMAWRRDAEARVRTAKSKSQELRFALAELFNVMPNPHLVKATFEEFYENRMNLSIENVLDEAESCVFVTDVVEENAKLEGYTLIQEKKTEASLVAVDYRKEEGGVIQWWKKNKDGSATLLGEEKIEPGKIPGDVSFVVKPEDPEQDLEG